VAPIVAVFSPVFFVRTGMNVKLGGLGGSTVVLGLVLVVTAIVGKLASGLGVRSGKGKGEDGPGVDRLTIGLGMMPRGEVGLIFADAGARIAPGGTPLLSPGIYAALVAAVFATTLVAPPALAARIRARRRSAEARTAPVAEAHDKSETADDESA
jgi:Kef-type K+ transport system membrane component KefB